MIIAPSYQKLWLVEVDFYAINTHHSCMNVGGLYMYYL